MKASTYYIGDPCYVFGASWSDILNETDFFYGAEQLRGQDICVGNTTYGDGEYYDNFGRVYYVDAGLIGILPINLLDIDKIESIESIHRSKYMHVIKFDNDFDCYVENGVFHFGNIIINTNDEDE